MNYVSAVPVPAGRKTSCGRPILRHPSRPVNSLSMLVSSSSANSSRRTRSGQESPRSHLETACGVSRPYARQHGSASVPVGGVLRRCESRLAPDKSKYNHGSLLTRRRYLKRRILRRADSAKLHLLRPGTTGLCVSPDLKRNKPRGSSAYAKPPGARMNRKGNAGMFPCSFQMTLRNAWLKPCRAPVSP